MTPNLDALANDGVLFTRAYASSPSCVPARAAIMTGKYPHQCGCPSYITHLPEHETLFFSLLRGAGYHTAYLGKMHLGTSRVDPGLDYADIVDSHTPRPEAPQADSYQQWLWDAGFRQATELIDLNFGPRLSAQWKTSPRYHVDEYVGDQGVRWLKHSAPTDQPWCCTVSFPGPHMPIDCGSFPEADSYDARSIDMPSTRFEMLADRPEHNALAHGDPPAPWEPLTEDEIRGQRRAYYANVSLIDRKIGEIVDVLRNRGFYDNTLVVVTSDHGDYLGDFGLNGKGQNVHEVLMRVPLIVKPARCEVRGKRESSLVCNVDIAATLLRSAAVSVPDDMASRDLSPYWAAELDLDDRDLVYMEAAGIRVLRDRRWKFCHYQGRDYGELYDLQSDPWETTNRWDDPEQHQRKQRFMRSMVDVLIGLSPRSASMWNVGAPPL